MERGEQPDAALMREVKQESGLDIEVEGPIDVCADPGLPFLEIVMKCKLIAGDFRPSDEVDSVAYIDLDTIPQDIGKYQKNIIANFFSKGNPEL